MSDENQLKDYQQDNYEQYQESHSKQNIIEQKQPQQRLIGLVRETNQESKQQSNQENSGSTLEKAQLISQLKGVLHQKVNEVKELKRSITKCKNQIKQIGEEVDKEMNKSIMKHAKPYATVNIHDLFGTPKVKDPRLNQLNEELSKVRGETKKVKQQLKTLEVRLTTPVSMMNQQKIQQVKSKIKETETQIKIVSQEKQYITNEIKLMNSNTYDEAQSVQAEIKENKEKNANLINDIKDEKSKLYAIEKQDRVLMEKIKFLEEADFYSEARKMSRNNALDHTQKQQIEEEIKQLVKEINQLLQEKTKVENEKRNHLKNLNQQSTALESKNWEIINKLREIDSFLLKHYSSKVKRTKFKREKPQEMSESFTKLSVLENKKPVESNDKNINSQLQAVQLVEKRKTYDFFMGPVESNQIQLSDEFLGAKVLVESLSFVVDQELLYGFYATYTNENKRTVFGYKIVPKIKPKDVVTQSLKLEKGELVNFLQVGNDKAGYIKYLQIITSEGKQFKWGKLQNCERNEQKNIRKYESMVMKGKLIQIESKQGPNNYCLGGIAASVVYLAPK